MNSNNQLPEVIRNIIQAMCAVDEGYYNIPRAKVSPAKRERAYCYELYHQMRLIDGFGVFKVHGEPDKRGNYNFNSSNPDFIIHKPGNDGRPYNLATIEVKVSDAQPKIIEDLRQLRYMITRHGYQYGAFILIGRSMSWFKKRRKKAIYFMKNDGEICERIYIICQSNFGERVDYQGQKENLISCLSLSQLQKELLK